MPGLLRPPTMALACFFNTLKPYYINVVNLWRLLASCLRFATSALDIRSFRGSSARLLIMIRGPNFCHPWLMILSSAAMVCSCGPDAGLTSIVNCFIYPFYFFLAKQVMISPRLGSCLTPDPTVANMTFTLDLGSSIVALVPGSSGGKYIPPFTPLLPRTGE